MNHPHRHQLLTPNYSNKIRNRANKRLAYWYRKPIHLNKKIARWCKNPIHSNEKPAHWTKHHLYPNRNRTRLDKSQTTSTAYKNIIILFIHCSPSEWESSSTD
jgi:hypothetical protein